MERITLWWYKVIPFTKTGTEKEPGPGAGYKMVSSVLDNVEFERSVCEICM